MLECYLELTNISERAALLNSLHCYGKCVML